MSDTLLNLNELLEETLNDIPDAPDFSNPPPGEYTLECKSCKIDTYTSKEGKEVNRLRIIYGVVDTLSVADGSAPVPNGTMFSETFQASRQGLSYFKLRVKSIMKVTDLDDVTLSNIMEAVKGATFNARLNIKKTPNPSGGEYENVQLRVIP